MRISVCVLVLTLCAIAINLTGCGDATAIEDPAVLRQREEFILSKEPKGMLAFSEAKDAIEQDEEVVIGGRIDAGEFEPWDDDRAAFIVTDITLDAHKHNHKDGHECAFCKAKNDPIESMATLQFLDKDGKVIDIDARKLLGIKKKQVVVVKGTGNVDDLGQLTVAVNGIFVRNSDEK